MFYKNKNLFFRTSGEDKSMSLCFIKIISFFRTSGEDKSVSLCFIKIKSFF